ncbi:hypothetical protein K438DRAFT_1808125 [Mycena galopus ATCC 62051]|nr:hypothetical protein K438DRAFT_1808125 [Mycena galopus ATCC 62051]
MAIAAIPNRYIPDSSGSHHLCHIRARCVTSPLIVSCCRRTVRVDVLASSGSHNRCHVRARHISTHCVTASVCHAPALHPLVSRCLMPSAHFAG